MYVVEGAGIGRGVVLLEVACQGCVFYVLRVSGFNANG